MIYLASQSLARQKVLSEAGVPYTIKVSGVDESLIKAEHLIHKKPIEETAMALAVEKALTVSKDHRHDYIIGADQICVCDNQAFDKAESLEEAKDQLRFFRNKTHHLVSATVLVKNGEVLWSTIVNPELTMRDFSDDFLDYYCQTLDQELLRSAGCYQVEGLGSQLFSEIKGDIFSIMGLPLLPLLEILRHYSLVKA